MFFEYKTYNTQVFKIKETDTGLEKALVKTDEFNPPKNDNFSKTSISCILVNKGTSILSHCE